MIRAVQTYSNDLIETFGHGWNEFWFTPRAGASTLLLQRTIAVVALAWLMSFSGELNTMFGVDGWLSREVVHQTTTAGDLAKPAPGFSHLFLSDSAMMLWGGHAIAIAVALLAVLGVQPRWTLPMTLVAVLSYVHRGPMLASAFETVLCMLLVYLSIRSQSRATTEPHWLTNVAVRLIQLHLCGIYLLIAFSKLGTPVWWTGDAAWYLFMDQQHRLVGLESLARNTLLGNAVTHAWLVIELLFPVLVWFRKLRPLMILATAVLWIATALVTGQIGFSLLMLVANLAFVSPTLWSRQP